MPGIQCADPLRDIGIAWDYSIGHNGQFVENMSCAVRLYQSLGIDADSHPVVIKMEKELGKNLLQIARNALLLSLKGIDLPYETSLQFSDQGNKIYHDMKIGSFSLGHCLINPDNFHRPKKRVYNTSSDPFAVMRNRVSKLYAASYIDNYGHRKIMHLYDYGNEQRLIKEVKHEIAKYKDTIGSSPTLI